MGLDVMRLEAKSCSQASQFGHAVAAMLSRCCRAVKGGGALTG